MKLNNVLYIPDFHCNLLSVSRLTKEHNCAITFMANACIAQDLASKTLIGMGRHQNGLYFLEPIQGMALKVSKQLDDDLWHQRLGHTSDIKMNSIGFNSSIAKNKIPCDSCIRAKQTRLPFPLSSIKTNSCFEMIHCDIWGRHATASTSGAHYFLTIVDDFSRGVWIYLMWHKSEVENYLPKFICMIETQFEKRIKRVRRDHGLEFTSNHMQRFYTEKGIVMELTCTYTPQQNGVVERKHRHILEMARALRFHAQLPVMFWGECVLTAVHIINKLPTKILDNKTPYEVIFRKKPNYDYLRVFGCLVYVLKTRKEGKFDERGRPNVFIGYPNGQKGYKTYDIERKETHVSRDVIFFENKFPFKNWEKQVLKHLDPTTTWEDETGHEQNVQ